MGEEGGIIAGPKVNGSVQEGKVLIKVGDKEYEGSFSSPNTAELSWKDPSGRTGKVIAQLVML